MKQKAIQAARKLLFEARQNEPLITKDLQIIADSVKAEMVGLENKFKSEKSLQRKLSEKFQARNIPIDKIAKRNNDTLRYTFVFEKEKYGAGVSEALSLIKTAGYEISRIWNAWSLENSDADAGYRGINVTVISSQNQKFELQFHTKASFRHKTETHQLYEEFRTLKTSDERKIEIAGTILEAAKKVKRPPGI